MKRIISLILILAFMLSSLSSCRRMEETEDADLTVAALESAYGDRMWREVCAAFEEMKGIKIKLICEKNLEDVISARMKAGDYPDLVHLATGREAALTETLIRGNALSDLSPMLEMTVPGEDIKVSEKITDGFTDTLATNPYKNEKTYLAPMFYSPCGLFYNAGLFEKMGWEVPETWDGMWELGDIAKKKGIYLFTYPTAGYFDSFIFALLASAGGAEFYNDCMNYKEGIWESEEADSVFEIMEKLPEYTEPSTVANANGDNYLKNQQLILDNRALFMPNGNWVVGEMEASPRAEGFRWGFCALPAIDDDRYSYTFFEQCWIPKEAKNKDLAMEFCAFLYSDKAAEIFARSGAIQPIKGSSALASDEAKLFYSIYDDGAEAVMGGFAATEPLEGVSIADTLFSSVNSIMTGELSVPKWRQEIIEVTDRLRKLKK